MKVRDLFILLATCDLDDEIFLCPSLKPLEAVEVVPGDEHIARYVVLHDDEQ